MRSVYAGYIDCHVNLMFQHIFD
uniref:Uncharacterized protein n=1 Tax=Arundo donax TaxID=35708 RepID=A0A0A9BDD2_ARUDO